MPKKTLKIWILKKVLKLPQPLQRLLKGLGLYGEALEISNRLYEYKEMKSFTSAVRKHRIRKLILAYYRGQDIGSHIPGFYPFLVPASFWMEYPDLLLAKGAAPPETTLPLVARCTHPKAIEEISLGLHIHAFYVDGLAMIRDAILQNKTLPELYITGPESIRSTVHEIMSGYPRSINFFSCENIGRDVVPFLRMLSIMRTYGHDLVGHVHVKKSVGVREESFVSKWSSFMLSSMVGEPFPGGGSIDNIASHFTESSNRPVLYLPHMSDPESWGRNPEGWCQNRSIAEDLFQILHTGPLPDRFVFSAGTMFWATPSYLRSFEALDLPWELLAQEPLPSDGTVLHAIERLFGALAFARQDPVAICIPNTISFVHSQSLMQK